MGGELKNYYEAQNLVLKFIDDFCDGQINKDTLLITKVKFEIDYEKKLIGKREVLLIYDVLLTISIWISVLV